jgi:hypothetical protein
LSSKILVFFIKIGIKNGVSYINICYYDRKIGQIGYSGGTSVSFFFATIFASMMLTS